MTLLPARSCQPQQRQDCCRQIICMAPAGNDVFYFKGCYCFTDWRLAVRPKDATVSFLHRHHHSCIDILVQQINDLPGRDIRFQFGDHLYRRSRVFLDFLCMDGDEVSSSTMCPTTQCTTCWCPKAQLSDPDAVFPFRNTEEVREKVAAERCKAEVCYISSKYAIY